MAQKDGRRRAFTNARLLDPAGGLDTPGALLVDDGLIAGLGADLFADGVPEDAEIIDCRGHGLCPGLIDMRAFLGEPGAEHKETIATASQAAAAGGVTTMIAMPDTHPVIDDAALVEFIKRRAQETAIVRIHPMAAITKGLKGTEMTEMGLLADAGAVGLTDGERTIADAQLMRRALSYASNFDRLIMHHAEEPALARDGCMNEGEVATRLGLPGIPNAAEAITVERDINLADLTGGRYHVACVSISEAVVAVRRAKERHLPVTCGVAPVHFALNESAVGEYRTFAKTSPPLRSESDRQAIVDALADGTIDVIASSHSPQDPESKRLPFAQAAYGVVGLETLLPLALELYHNGALSLLSVLRAMTDSPARLLDLPGGALRRDAPADLLVFDLEVPWQINPESFRSKSKNSPFEGRPVQGRALMTVVAGETVYTHDGFGGTG